MRLLVTGATGYIGQRLVRHAVAQGHEVIAASRRRPQAAVGWVPFELSSAAAFELPPALDAIVHLAAVTHSKSEGAPNEEAAARRLVELARHAGARFVFVSSQTAREDAPTSYGRTKWRIEREVLAAGGLVVRPGQVYGGPEAALFGMLVRSVRAMPVLPAFLPAPRIQPVHVDDLAVALLRCAELPGLQPAVLRIGAAVPISFTRFLQVIAARRVRRWRLPVSVPVAMIRFAATAVGPRAAERLGLARLVSLFGLPRMETANDLETLGLQLRSLEDGMSRSGDGRRRDLIDEARVLLAYLLKEAAAPALARRYVRCIESLREGEPMHLPHLLQHMPAMLGLLEGAAWLPAAQGRELAWRLNAAMVLGEASTRGAARFLAAGEPAGRLRSLVRLAAAVAAEAFWRAGSMLSRPLLGSFARQPGPGP